MLRFRPPFAVAFAVLLALFAAAVALRMHAVERNIGQTINCAGCFDAAVLRADLQVLGALCVLLLLAGWLRRRPVTLLVHLLVGLALLVLAADALVHWLFRYRLFLADAWTYVAEYQAVWNQLSGGVGSAVLAALVLFGAAAAVAVLVIARSARGPVERVLLAVIALASLGASAVIARPAYVNNWAIANTFVLNFDRPDAVLYSDRAAADLLAGSRSTRRVTGGPRERRNLVVVIVESWSAWHSEAFGGYEDWTPELDDAARRGVSFDDFHAVAYSTERGLVGLLAGQDLWAPFHSWLKGELFYGLWDLRPSLPSVFDSAGYHTAFLTTGPLSLYRKGEWLRSLGFAETEGGSHPFYDGLPRFAFGAPSDRALYARALEWQAQAPDPYLLVLETVTTHQPYKDPDSGAHSLERAMRYADGAFGDYLRALEASGFFDNGLLLAASDHRSMTPIPAEELRRFGFRASSRVPAFLLDPRARPRSDGRVLSQSDLVPSFRWWLDGEVTLGAHDALLFDVDHASSLPGPCAFHLRGDVPGVLNVVCPEGHGELRMEGDATRFLSYDGLDRARREALVEYVGQRRLATQARHRAHPAPETSPGQPSEEDTETP